MIARLSPPLLIAALALIFFANLVLHPTQVLYSEHSDLIAEHLPAKRFLVRSWQETGELPLWCPYSFAGSAFVHDPQVAMFYPPHGLLLLLPEEYVGAGMSWLVVLHLMIAGWGAYAYARSQGLGVPAALVSACGFMFAGKWMLHLLGGGHYITIGLAWLPWVLLLFEGAIRRGSFLWATAAGAAFALIVLGTHPQWTFYSGLFLALWTLPGYGSLRRWFVCGAWVALVAGALSAVQLLPTWEAAGLSTRAAGVASDDILEAGMRSLRSFVGPTSMWEDHGGFGLLWLIAAALAPLLCRGRVRYQAGVCLALILFSLGGAIVFQSLPGFRVFRQPARMLLIVTLPMALLAGSTVQTLLDGIDAETRGRCRRLLLLLSATAILICVLDGSLQTHVYWLCLLITLPATWWLLGTRYSVLSTRYGLLIGGLLLLIDLWALAWPLVQVRPEADIYRSSDCVALLQRARGEGHRILDRDAPGLDAGTPLGGGAPLALIAGLEPLRGFNPLDNGRYKEYLQFIAGADEPLRPLDGPLTFPVIGNFPIRNKPLLDLLGTGYALQPTTIDNDWSLTGDGWRIVAQDDSPIGYDLVSGGLQALPGYTVYENTQAFPRAFVVPTARPLPERSQVLDALTTTDLHSCVLLEGWDGSPRPGDLTATFRPAESVECRPNRVTVRLAPGSAGYLILADIWYPGWRCTIDGREASLYRADYLFRAVELPENAHEVVFTFEPASFRLGRIISLTALAGVVLIGLLAGIRSLAAR